MLKLDNDLLIELGLGGLPEDQKQAMLQHIYDTLELRVGTRLANQMTDQQLDEFERFIDVNGDADQAQALQWLEANLPHYKDVVNQVFEELKAEIRQMAPQIMAASMQQSGGAASTADPATGVPVGQPPVAQQQTVPAAQAQVPVVSAVPPQMATQPPQPATNQPYPASLQSQGTSVIAQPPQPAQGQTQDQATGAQLYQFPAQQPPAGPGGAQDDQRAA